MSKFPETSEQGIFKHRQHKIVRFCRDAVQLRGGLWYMWWEVFPTKRDFLAAKQ